MVRGQRYRILLASAALLAALGSFAEAHAQGADDATLAAIAKWRAATLNIVDPTFHDIVAAGYADQKIDADSNTLNSAMIARAKAEQAAWASLDPTSVALIENYYSSARDFESQPDGSSS